MRHPPIHAGPSALHKQKRIPQILSIGVGAIARRLPAVFHCRPLGQMLIAIAFVFSSALISAGFLGSRSVQAQVPSEEPSALAGFSVSETYDLPPAKALDLKESFLVKTLYRVGKVSPSSFAEFSLFTENVDVSAANRSPRDFRFWSFSKSARLKRLTVVRLPTDRDVNAIGSGGIKAVYLATCEMEGDTNEETKGDTEKEMNGDSKGQQPLFLLCRSAPRMLPLDQPLDEPIRFSGFFYNSVKTRKNGQRLEIEFSQTEDQTLKETDVKVDGDSSTPEIDPSSNTAPLMIVKRFAWYPRATNDATGVSAGQVELASHGVDIGLLDFVKAQNNRRLSKQDADCFYQMLNAAKNAGVVDAEMKDGEQTAATFIEIMKSPNAHFGGRVKVTGNLRQCVRIAVPERQHAGATGIKEYWQVHLFPDLGGRPVVIKSGDDERLEFSRYPVTVCLPKLPDGQTAASMAGKIATVEGYLYRFVRYQSQKSEEAGKDGMVSPMVMARGVELVSVDQAASAIDSLMRFLVSLFLVLIAGVFVWRILQWRRRFWPNSNRRKENPGASISDLPDRIDVENIEDQYLIDDDGN